MKEAILILEHPQTSPARNESKLLGVQGAGAFIARNRQYAQDSNTYNGYSLHLARQLMQKQTSKHKVIIFIGDGGYDNTEYADIYPDLEMANAARREGIRILYLAIGEYVDPYSPNYARTWHQHALRLAGGEENYIQIADFDVNLHCFFISFVSSFFSGNVTIYANSVQPDNWDEHIRLYTTKIHIVTLGTLYITL
ncbi:hypothetical protein Y032_0041g415 [Ancylostoma ceylanicum]|uniref:VWFA domain-containing protein n=1 Tax=Ancylostoma ceylanicum TaxID=53326 RepID=A0A016UFX2_9BILA|nr:hypothetical protein Y032_0041g415 [Ancylostoma ceylanicum]